MAGGAEKLRARGGVGGWLVGRAGLTRVTSAAMAVGLGMSAVLEPARGLTVTLLAAALAPTVWVLLRGRPRGRDPGPGILPTALVLLALFAGLTLGTMRVEALTRSALAPLKGSTYAGELVVCGSSSSYPGKWDAPARVESCQVTGEAGAGAVPAALGETVLLEMAIPAGSAGAEQGGQMAAAPVEGTRVKVTGILATPRGPSASGYDQRSSLRRQGISMVLGVQTCDVLGRRGGMAGVIDALRQKSYLHLSQGLDGTYAALLRGAILGVTDGVPEEILVAYRRAGTSHMLAVSGMNVASLAAIALWLVGLLRLPRWAGVLAGLGVVGVFVSLTGASPSVVRAATMISLVMAAGLVGRGRERWQVLFLAALLMLFKNPFSLFSPSFQLSFAAVAGLLAFSRWLERGLQWLPSWLASGVSVSLAATLGTAPIALAVFGQTSLVGVLANVMVVPVLPAVMALGLASLVAGFVWLPLAGALNTLAGLGLSWTVQVSRACAVFPLLETRRLGVAVAAGLGMAAALPFALSLSGRDVRLLGRWALLRRLRRRTPRSASVRRLLVTLVLVCAGVLSGLLSPLAGMAWEGIAQRLPGNAWPRQVEVRVLDVGQGNAVLVRTPEGHAALVDGGPQGCRLGSQLRVLGVRRLDLVVISHPHSDHFAGLLEALGQVDVGIVVDQVRLQEGLGGGTRAPPGGTNGQGGSQRQGGGSREAHSYLSLRDGLKAGGAGYHEAVSGDVLSLDGVELRLLVPARPLEVIATGDDPWAARGSIPPGGDELNAASVVVEVRSGSLGILVPGDAEADVLARYPLGVSEVLLVPHHGSAGAVSEDLLRRVGARAALVSVGAGNSFGHPAASTMGFLERQGLKVVRTDQRGCISVTFTEDGLAVWCPR